MTRQTRFYEKQCVRQKGEERSKLRIKNVS